MFDTLHFLRAVICYTLGALALLALTDIQIFVFMYSMQLYKVTQAISSCSRRILLFRHKKNKRCESNEWNECRPQITTYLQFEL